MIPKTIHDKYLHICMILYIRNNLKIFKLCMKCIDYI